MMIDVFDCVFVVFLCVCVWMKSELMLRLWWLFVFEITSARGVKSVNDSFKKSDVLEELCRMFVDDVVRLVVLK